MRQCVLFRFQRTSDSTGYEVGNPQTVLDGNLDGFIDAELKRRRAERIEIERPEPP